MGYGNQAPILHLANTIPSRISRLHSRDLPNYTLDQDLTRIFTKRRRNNSSAFKLFVEKNSTIMKCLLVKIQNQFGLDLILNFQLDKVLYSTSFFILMTGSENDVPLSMPRVPRKSCFRNFSDMAWIFHIKRCKVLTWGQNRDWRDLFTHQWSRCWKWLWNNCKIEFYTNTNEIKKEKIHSFIKIFFKEKVTNYAIKRTLNRNCLN